MQSKNPARPKIQRDDVVSMLGLYYPRKDTLCSRLFSNTHKLEVSDNCNWKLPPNFPCWRLSGVLVDLLLHPFGTIMIGNGVSLSGIDNWHLMREIALLANRYDVPIKAAFCTTLHPEELQIIIITWWHLACQPTAWTFNQSILHLSTAFQY